MGVKKAKKRVVRFSRKIRSAKVARKMVRRIKRTVTKVCIKAAKASCPCSLVKSLKKKTALAKKKFLAMRAQLLKLRMKGNKGKKVVKRKVVRRKLVTKKVVKPRALVRAPVVAARYVAPVA